MTSALRCKTSEPGMPTNNVVDFPKAGESGAPIADALITSISEDYKTMRNRLKKMSKKRNQTAAAKNDFWTRARFRHNTSLASHKEAARGLAYWFNKRTQINLIEDNLRKMMDEENKGNQVMFQSRWTNAYFQNELAITSR